MYGSSSSSFSRALPERRSTAGPMEWEPENPRKRAHYDPSANPSPFAHISSSHQQQYTNGRPLFPFKSAPSPLVDSPFLFHSTSSGTSALGPTPAMVPQSTFDPSSFSFGSASKTFGIPEVEMTSGPSELKEEDSKASSWYGIEGGGSSSAVGGELEPLAVDSPVRKVAGGAVLREMRKREGAAGGGGGGGSSSLRRKPSAAGSLRSRGAARGRNRRDKSAGEEDEHDEERSGSSEGERSDDDPPHRSSASRSSRRSRQNTSSSSALQRTNDNSRNPTQQNFNLHLPGRTVSHGEIPYILLGYLQFFFNLSLVLILLYLAVQFILTVKSDIARKVEEVSFEILQEIASCTNLYLANQCDPARRVPGMQQSCTAWEYCMNRDPTVVGRAKVGAETFAGVVNSFVDPISWKTMSFTLTTLTFLTIVLNSALSFYRSSHRPPHLSHSPTHQHQHHQHLPWQQQQYPGLPPPSSSEYGNGGGGGRYYEGMPRGWGAPEGPGEGAKRLGEGGEGEKEKGKGKKGWF